MAIYFFLKEFTNIFAFIVIWFVKIKLVISVFKELYCRFPVCEEVAALKRMKALSCYVFMRFRRDCILK